MGDVYVAGAEEKQDSADRDIVYEYSPSEGKVVEKLQTFQSGEVEEELEDISGLAVDPNGVLWVYWEEEGVIDGFTKQLNKAQTKTELVWQRSLRRTPEVESKFECSASRGFAVAPGDEAFYVGYERESAAEGCPGEEEQTPDAVAVAKLDNSQPVPRTLASEVDGQNTTGVAADSSNGVVYLDNGTSVGGVQRERRADPTVRLRIARRGRRPGGGSQSGDVFVAEPGEDRVEVFRPEEEAHAPVVDAVSAQSLTPESDELHAQIDPGGCKRNTVSSTAWWTAPPAHPHARRRRCRRAS